MKIQVNNVYTKKQFEIGEKLADITITDIASPYTIEVENRKDLVYVENNTVKAKKVINSSNVDYYNFKIIDAESSVFYTENFYPPVTANIQSKFPYANTIYKITTEIDLEGATLNIYGNSILVFEGGAIRNGTLNLNKTLIYPYGCIITDYITATITGTYKEGQCLYDTEHKKPKWWDGGKWVDATGQSI